jgi:SAM-dependent methyltransferase
MAVSELEQMKNNTRATWASGDYATIAKHDLWELGERIVERAGVSPGEDVLDVACGTGNAAIRAADAGARVVGLDLTPELLDAGRHEAAEAGVEVEWLEGDAEALPFPDESFDVVLSVMGCMFAPRHDVTARELARVLRPGGRLALFGWTPEGPVGRFFKTLGAYMPPPPAFAMPPLLWGTEGHVRELFDGTGVELEFTRELSTNPSATSDDSADERIEFYTTTFGPLMKLRESTEAQGRWPALRDDLTPLYENTEEPGEYLVVLGTKT